MLKASLGQHGANKENAPIRYPHRAAEFLETAAAQRGQRCKIEKLPKRHLVKVDDRIVFFVRAGEPKVTPAVRDLLTEDEVNELLAVVVS